MEFLKCVWDSSLGILNTQERLLNLVMISANAEGCFMYSCIFGCGT